MNNVDNFSKYIIDNLNLSHGDYVEIVGPCECEELVESLERVALSSFLQPFITYNNLDDDYYLSRNTLFYEKLMANNFSRIVITSSFISSKNKYFLETHSLFLSNYFEKENHKYTIVVYPNKNWARNLDIKYEFLRDRIISISSQENTLSKYINKLYKLNIKYVHLYNELGTDLKMELTDKFRFNNSLVEAYDKSLYKKNIPCLEIFTSPIRILPVFASLKVIYSRGLDSIIKEDESLGYVGELGISRYNEFVFYNILLDENSSIHIALGNSYSLGIKKKELIKLNKSKHHIDLPIGTKDMIIKFYDKDNKLVCVYENDDFNFGV